ncbi:hypothetical protein FALCPG4_015424 [Fusarium falciforme]
MFTAEGVVAGSGRHGAPVSLAGMASFDATDADMVTLKGAGGWFPEGLKEASYVQPTTIDRFDKALFHRMDFISEVVKSNLVPICVKC